MRDYLPFRVAGERALEPRPSVRADERRERFTQRCVARVLPVLGAPAHHRSQLGGQLGRALGREPRLSDPGSAEDRDELRSPLAETAPEDAEDLAELVLPADERCLEPSEQRRRLAVDAVEQPDPVAEPAGRGVSHEPPGAVCDADLVLPRLGEEPVRLIHWKARDERVTSARVARDDLPGRECRAANGIVAAHLAGSAHSPQRVALVRARDAEDRK